MGPSTEGPRRCKAGSVPGLRRRTLVGSPCLRCTAGALVGTDPRTLTLCIWAARSQTEQARSPWCKTSRSRSPRGSLHPTGTQYPLSHKYPGKPLCNKLRAGKSLCKTARTARPCRNRHPTCNPFLGSVCIDPNSHHCTAGNRPYRPVCTA